MQYMHLDATMGMPVLLPFATMSLPCTKVPRMCRRQLFMQLHELSLAHNQLVGSLPEAWSNLTNVSPVIELAC